MSQPELECVAQLGDVSPVEHGGYWVFRDKTGQFPAQVEYLIPPEENEFGLSFRFDLHKCTYQDGILSENEFHPTHPAWFADDLSKVADCSGYPLEKLIQDFCSDDLVCLARAYEMVANYHGWENFDSYPLELRTRECRKRYKSQMYQVVGG